MLETSSNWLVELDKSFLEAVDALLGHPAYEALVKQAKARRDVYFDTLAHKLMTDLKPVDQRVIDEKRGFWNGVIWGLEVLPNIGKSQWDEFLRKELEEGDEA